MQIRMGDIFIRPKDGHKIEVYKLKQDKVYFKYFDNRNRMVHTNSQYFYSTKYDTFKVDISILRNTITNYQFVKIGISA